MRLRYLFFIILLSVVEAHAEQQLQVIYPSQNQKIPPVDSTFILGNVTPGARLWIDDIEIPVHRDGGWLAFSDISPGPFRFHLMSVLRNDTLWSEWPIQVGPDNQSLLNSERPHAFNPNGQATYAVGSTMEFSFEARAGGRGWFYLDRQSPMEMYRGPLTNSILPGEVFGTISRNDFDTAMSRYAGYYTFTNSDTGKHKIAYIFKELRRREGIPEIFEDTLEYAVTVIPAFPPTIGILSGAHNIIRTGPGKGFKLLYQPSEINVVISGMHDGFYELSLAPNVIGYIDVDSVTILPRGTPIPRGSVSVITVDKAVGGIKIIADIGKKLPYEIVESPDMSQINVDLFGVTGDVDWIRYNVKSPLARAITWSQPQDGIFRLTIDTDYIWGYEAGYDSTRFVLFLREKPQKRSFFASNLKGVKIVIDPGHSSDNGAVGPTGFKEKDANLWIAHELRRMLEARGAKVLMTRYGHEHRSLYSRPEIAEQWGADILISVHNNALPDGINPFFNNGTSAYYYYPHSRPLAEAVHSRMLKRTGLPDHGLYYGNLALTRYSSVPSVLIECAFMMIPEQEAMLKTDNFQRKCAKAIVEGINDFLKSRK